MNKFKKGDKIRIKDEVSSETHCEQYPHFLERMDEMKDKVLTIRGFAYLGNIRVEEFEYNLHPEWVEPVKEFKKGDKIRIKKEVSSETHRKQSPNFIDSMDEMKDEVLTIRGFTNTGYIKVGNYAFILHPEWVEKATEWAPAPEDDLGSVLAEIAKQLCEEYDTILEEAQEILEGDRESDYGDPVANFNRISGIASSILNETITPEQCVVVMMAVKLSREQYKHKRDNLVDLVAYTEIYNRIKEH